MRFIRRKGEIVEQDYKRFEDFQRVGNGGIHLEIAQYLKRKVESGALREGEKLPSLRKLAELWKTNFFSVKLATDQLVDNGILNKQQGRGMFVAPKAEKIQRIGVYSSRVEQKHESFSFFKIQEIVCRRLQERGIEYEIWNDYRPFSEHSVPPESLKEAVVGGRIQALIGVVIRSCDTWFHLLPIRKTSIMADFQITQACREIARQLSARKCHRIAAIIPETNSRQNFLQVELKKGGMTIRKNRLRSIPESESIQNDWTALGYYNTLELLRAPSRPDALIVYPDEAAGGAIQAILSLGIKVPEDLCVVLHRNVELDYFTPFPVIWLDTHLSTIAERMIQEILGHEKKDLRPETFGD